MTEKTLMVCGCSYSALSLQDRYANTHFSELIANTLGWKLINNSYQGCSNGGIRLQIDEVIKRKPDFAIIIPTFHDRTEIPVTALKVDWSIIDWLNFEKNLKKSGQYDPTNGIMNINFKDNKNYNLICENYNSLVHGWKHLYRNKQELSNEAIQAIKDYLSYLYDDNWKKQLDRWIIEHGCLELIHNNIPFVLIPTLSLWQNFEKPNLLPSKYITTEINHCPCHISTLPEFSYGDYTKESYKDPGYHSNIEGQKYLANTYLKLMKERWNI